MNAHAPIAHAHPDRAAYSASREAVDRLQIADELVRVIMFLDPDIYHDSRDVAMVTRLTFLISDEIEKAQTMLETISGNLHAKVHPKEFARNRAMEAAEAAE